MLSLSLISLLAVLQLSSGLHIHAEQRFQVVTRRRAVVKGVAGTKEEDSRDGQGGTCPSPGAVQPLACQSAADEAPLAPYTLHTHFFGIVPLYLLNAYIEHVRCRCTVDEAPLTPYTSHTHFCDIVLHFLFNFYIKYVHVQVQVMGLLGLPTHHPHTSSVLLYIIYSGLS